MITLNDSIVDIFFFITIFIFISAIDASCACARDRDSTEQASTGEQSDVLPDDTAGDSVCQTPQPASVDNSDNESDNIPEPPSIKRRHYEAKCSEIPLSHCNAYNMIEIYRKHPYDTRSARWLEEVRVLAAKIHDLEEKMKRGCMLCDECLAYKPRRHV